MSVRQCGKYVYLVVVVVPVVFKVLLLRSDGLQPLPLGELQTGKKHEIKTNSHLEKKLIPKKYLVVVVGLLPGPVAPPQLQLPLLLHLLLVLLDLVLEKKDNS